ncbi:alpha/beta hydrolase [Lactococcus hodotermopsidis]|nr:alpha/beta hydrolase [Lactococcus hodotermopsidis]
MKKLLKLSLSTLSTLCLASVSASFYFFHVAQVRGKKAFIDEAETPKSSPLYQDEQDFLKLDKKTLTIENDGLTLKAWYVPAETKTNKTAIIVHGFNGCKEEMMAYGMLFHRLGYHVLMPDNRAHGISDGSLIGYGVTDKRDLIAWTNMLISTNAESEIIYFGLSMGAATVMLSTREHLPKNVKSIIEDCGYTSVWDELSYQAKQMYGLPKFPLLYEVSAISKLRAGFSYDENGASAVKSLENNKLPVLFIHGTADDFVPTEMVNQNFAATKGPRELWLVKGAKHAKSLETDRNGYYAKVADFLAKYGYPNRL